MAELAATGLLLFHSVIEFDLQFGALAFLLALLLCGPDGATIDKTGLELPGSRATDKNPAPLAKGLITGIVATLCVPLCVMGLACATTSVVLQRANASGAYKTTIDRFWSNPWAVIDPNAQGAYLLACYLAKAAQPMAAKVVARTASFKTLKSKSVTVTVPLSVTKAQGKLTHAKVSGDACLTINKTTGKVTVKKGTKKKTYTIKIKVTAVGNANYKAGSKTVICKVTVK